MTVPPIDSLPGFRRRFRFEPGEGRVHAALEDDMHCMTLVLDHDGATITALTPRTLRAPWTTCPGAEQRLIADFVGQSLDEAAAGIDKRSNCTHLFDLAVLAASHARDTAPTIYDILVSDPVEGITRAELRCGGDRMLAWSASDDVLREPAAVAGRHLLALRDWIAGLDEPQRSHARMLQWASLIAHGRTMPESQLSDTSGMAGACFTFQPERIADARWIARRRDFSDGVAKPLDGTA